MGSLVELQYVYYGVGIMVAISGVLWKFHDNNQKKHVEMKKAHEELEKRVVDMEIKQAEHGAHIESTQSILVEMRSDIKALLARR